MSNMEASAVPAAIRCCTKTAAANVQNERFPFIRGFTAAMCNKAMLPDIFQAVLENKAYNKKFPSAGEDSKQKTQAFATV